MSNKSLLTISAAVFCSMLAFSAEAQMQVAYNNAGYSSMDMDTDRPAPKQYSLKLIFAENNGASLKHVGVVIRDTRGNVIMNNSSKGPVVLLNLKPGKYTVTSSVSGETKVKNIVVHGNGQNTYYINLHSAES